MLRMKQGFFAVTGQQQAMFQPCVHSRTMVDFWHIYSFARRTPGACRKAPPSDILYYGSDRKKLRKSSCKVEGVPRKSAPNAPFRRLLGSGRWGRHEARPCKQQGANECARARERPRRLELDAQDVKQDVRRSALGDLRPHRPVARSGRCGRCSRRETQDWSLDIE